MQFFHLNVSILMQLLCIFLFRIQNIITLTYPTTRVQRGPLCTMFVLFLKHQTPFIKIIKLQFWKKHCFSFQWSKGNPVQKKQLGLLKYKKNFFAKYNELYIRLGQQVFSTKLYYFLQSKKWENISPQEKLFYYLTENLKKSFKIICYTFFSSVKASAIVTDWVSKAQFSK